MEGSTNPISVVMSLYLLTCLYLFPNSGKTYQLFDKDRPNGLDKYYGPDADAISSVKLDGQNTAVMFEDGTYYVMVRLEIGDKSHNKPIVTDRDPKNSELCKIDGRQCRVYNITLQDGKKVDEDVVYKWYCFNLNEEGFPFMNHIVGYIALPTISTYKNIQNVVRRDGDGNITHINCALLDHVAPTTPTLTTPPVPTTPTTPAAQTRPIGMTCHVMPIAEFMGSKKFMTCELMGADRIGRQKYSIPDNTPPFVVMHGAVPIPVHMCPPKGPNGYTFREMNEWFASGKKQGEEYNPYADGEGIVIFQNGIRHGNKYFKVRHGSRAGKGEVVGDDKGWDNTKGCGVVFNVSNLLK